MTFCAGEDSERTKVLLKLIKSMRLEGTGKIDHILDLGCGRGSVTKKAKDATMASDAFGVDVDDQALKMANKQDITLLKVDLNSGKLPFIDNYFDLVMMIEVIEHLYNVDYALLESFRVLRSSGYLLLTTPNLAWWINRFVLLFGYQPYFTNVSLTYDVGKLRRRFDTGCNGQHIRMFTPKALKQLLELYGFRIIHIKGTTLELLPGFVR